MTARDHDEMVIRDEEGRPFLDGVALRSTWPAKFMVGCWLLILGLATYLLWNSARTAAVWGLASAGFGRVLAAVVGLVVLSHLIWSLGHWLCTVLFSIITGRVYIQNHLAYRLAGGWYISWLAYFLAVGGVFWLFSWTLSGGEAPLSPHRSYWSFVRWVLGTEFLLVLVLGSLAFLVFALRFGRGSLKEGLGGERDRAGTPAGPVERRPGA